MAASEPSGFYNATLECNNSICKIFVRKKSRSLVTMMLQAWISIELMELGLCRGCYTIELQFMLLVCFEWFGMVGCLLIKGACLFRSSQTTRVQICLYHRAKYFTFQTTLILYNYTNLEPLKQFLQNKTIATLPSWFINEQNLLYKNFKQICLKERIITTRISLGFLFFFRYIVLLM